MPPEAERKPSDNPDFKPLHPGVQKGLDDNTRLALERTALAHERTLMAWVRTCFSMIGFGFTIFTFFLSQHKAEHLSIDLRQPKTMCMALTLGGTLFMILAVVQNYQASRRLFNTGMEKGFSLAMFAAILVCAAGLLGSWAILTGPG